MDLHSNLYRFVHVGIIKTKREVVINKQKNTPSFTYLEALKRLSPAEIRVLDLVEQGYTNEEIANALIRSCETVKTHRKHICRKLHITGYKGLDKWLWSVKNEEKSDGK